MPANVEDKRLEKKYVVFGGMVRDGAGIKYIPPMSVIKAYGVNPRECVIGDQSETQHSGSLLHMRHIHKDLIILYPQEDPESYKKLPVRSA
jgi:hypothetical protein